MEKRLIKVIFIFSAILFLANVRQSFGQDEFSYGSPYTIFGIGNTEYYNNERINAMGIYGIALNGGSVNSVNPAANSSLTNTLFSMGFKYNYFKASDGINTMKTKDGNATGFNLGIPIDRGLGWSINIGFNPMYEVDYKVIQNVSVDGTPATATYAGTGGITRINGGVSFAGLKSISLGFEYDFAFGNLKKLSQLDFNDENIINSYRRTEDDLKGSFVKAGVVVDLKKMFSELPMEFLNLGFVFQSKLKLSSSTDYIYNTSLGNDTTNFESPDVHVPLAFGFGASGKIGRQLILSADVWMQQWSDFNKGGVYDANLQNSIRAGIGFEVTPPPKSDKSFFENKYYRGGFFYEKTQFNLNGNSVNGFGVSLGMGIPLTKYNNIDFAVSYITRGKSSDGLIKDDQLRITAGITFGELWFLRPSDEER